MVNVYDRYMRCVGLICLLAGLLLAGDAGGIRPRESSADYTAHQAASGATVAAAVIPPDQVKKLFATDLNAGGYIVIEVAIYPEAGKEIDVSSGDFLLRVGSNPAIVRNASASAIAAALQRKSTPPEIRRKSDVSVYSTATVGYETGTDGYGRRRSGVYTAAGVGVGVGDDPNAAAPPRPGSTDQDRMTMEQELADKALPEGKTTRAVAGYLYFPRPTARQRNAAYEITWYGIDRQVHLTIPAAK
jgi:hypothetical protein